MYGHRCDFFVIICFSLLCLQEVVECALTDELMAEPEALQVWRRARLVPPPPARAPAAPLACEKPPVYFCEEPPDAVPPAGDGAGAGAGAARSCDYRGVRYHEQVFRWVAGRGCLFYTPDFLFVGGANPLDLNAGCFYGDLYAPCLEIAKEDGTCGCFPFDPGLEAAARAVREALLPAARDRWERCFHAAAHCCAHLMTTYYDDIHTTLATPTAADGDGGGRQCAPTFDGWTCWGAAPAGTVAAELCSEFAYSGQGPSCYHYSSKECYANGTWEQQTQYGSCSIAPRLLARYRFHMWALGAGAAACLPAALLLSGYRRLRIPRVALHRNLLYAIIVRNALVIVTRSEIYIDELTSAATGESAMARHGWGCRALAVAERAASSAVFSCMLVEALYLHRSIAAVFRGPPSARWLYAAGAVIAWAPVAAWAGVMWARNDHSCWAVYTLAHVQWLLDAPRLLVLLANAALLADILRVLLTKLRNAENAHQLSTAKATMFLMPVFGSQFLLTALRPRPTDCAAEQAYYFAAYALEAAQGVLVALFYCYANKEVHMLIKSTYKKTENAFVSRVQGDSFSPRKSLAPAFDRRVTALTALPSTAEPEPEPEPAPAAAGAGDHPPATNAAAAPLKAKLHVAEIISIQASERLAEILDPVYESVEHTHARSARAWLQEGGGCGALERGVPAAAAADDSDYYGFTNASSVSFDCRDWIRGAGSASPAPSAYDACDPAATGAHPHHPHEYSNKPTGTGAGTRGEERMMEDFEYDECEMLDEILECMDGPASCGPASNPVGPVGSVGPVGPVGSVGPAALNPELLRSYLPHRKRTL